MAGSNAAHTRKGGRDFSLCCRNVARISKAAEMLRQPALILSASGILQRCEKSERLRIEVYLGKAETPTFNSSLLLRSE